MGSRFETLDRDFNWRTGQVDWPVTTATSQGLSGVIACETKVAWVNPNTGELSYRGIPIQDIAGNASFEEVAYLLVEGKHWRDHPEIFQSFCRRLHRVRQMPIEVLQILELQSGDTHPTRMLRAAISALGCHDIIPNDDIKENHRWEDVWMISQVAALVGHITRFRKGRKPLISDYRQTLAKDMLYMISREKPTREQEDLLNLLWVLFADHGLDAPAFTGMIVASSRANPYYNIVAGLSALRGTLLGGAVERIIRMFQGLRDANVARAWTEGMLAKGYIIPGFGHRMFRQQDPRVDIIKKVIPTYAITEEQKLSLEVLETIEETASAILNPKDVYVNIYFYSALLFHYLGIEPEMAPCFYAIGRMAGLVARVREYLADNRLIHPRVKYTGELNKKYLTLEER